MSEARAESEHITIGARRAAPRLTDGEPRGPASIEQAIRELQRADWFRLRRIGQILAWKVPSMDGEALLFDALERTLDGRRRWNHDSVDFVGHLIGIMRSVASHEAVRQGLDVVALTSGMVLVAPADQEDTLSAEEQIHRLRTHFAEHNDALALQVLEAMEDGCDGSAIREQLGLDQTRLASVVRRIRRVAVRVIAA
jgi:hypothetical protein